MKMIAMFLGLALTGGNAWAQNGAQARAQAHAADQNLQGYLNQQRQYQAAAQQPQQPRGEWIKTWGAIAMSPSGDAGSSVGKLTKEEAEHEAVQKCLSWGGQGCKPLLAYLNQCVAVAEGPKSKGGYYTAAASGPSIANAGKNALADCAEGGGTVCKVVDSACSEPIFRQY